MSDKETVLAEYPRAYAYQWAGPRGWVIYATRPGDPGHVGMSLSSPCATADAAWQEAAVKLSAAPEADHG